jgi:hypothetical protein
MQKVRTIACPECATRLRVRSLDAVSDSDACPECGAPLKPTADRQSADLQAAEAAPLHPALVEPSRTPRRLGPAGIAAAVTGLVGLAIAVPLLMSSPESQSADDLPSDAAPIAASKTSGSESESRPISIAAKDDRPDGTNSKRLVARVDGSASPEVIVVDPAVPANVVESKPTGSEIPIIPDGIKVAVGSENPTETSPIKQASGANETPGPSPDETPDTPETPSTAPRPAPRLAASLDERLDVAISKFELKKLTTLKSVLETVEIMANVQIDVSPEVDEAVSERDLVFSLENTSPRGILNEAATRSGLTVTVSGDRITLKPSAR